MKARSLLAEALGTALLVFIGAGTATLTFGFKITGTSLSAGVIATALAFGLVVLVLVYGIGPISGCHINPAITAGFLAARRIALSDAIGYWIAQIAGRAISRRARQARSSRSSSSASSARSGAQAESVIDSGRLAPGMGITTGDLASSQASVT